ncbi:hypothetical protein OIU84_004453 [Salix udensis]|uniref:(S)-ureidoglycine aminohydrolase n=1 Tax=Salix udensis TaxID=889485 RepID=A0AAD6K293_9ROSI|nr:hypothetical protein OIU84_004453 [Salix udensis]
MERGKKEKCIIINHQSPPPPPPPPPPCPIMSSNKRLQAPHKHGDSADSTPRHWPVVLRHLSVHYSHQAETEPPATQILLVGYFTTLAHLTGRNKTMKTSSLPSLLLLLSLSSNFLKVALSEDGGGLFCSAPSVFKTETASFSSSKPRYWKVTNPTLSPSHLQDLPGFTRSVYKRDHALITPESHVFSPLPEWTNTLGAYLITPAMGSHFVMYLAKMQENSKSGLPPNDVERFLFVVQGSATLINASGAIHQLTPQIFKHSLECDASATLAVFERRYSPLENHVTEQIVGSTDQQPLLETPGEVFELRKLLPPSLPYDFNIHIMDFQPGEFLNVKEVHYNQHGLLLLEGQGIYRLADSWYPVQSGDAIWMAPFVPQWYAALGKTRTRYFAVQRCE